MQVRQLADITKLKQQVGAELSVLRRLLGAVFVAGFFVSLLVDQCLTPDDSPAVAMVSAETSAPLMLVIYFWRRYALHARLRGAYRAFVAKLSPQDKLRATRLFEAG